MTRLMTYGMTAEMIRTRTPAIAIRYCGHVRGRILPSSDLFSLQALHTHAIRCNSTLTTVTNQTVRIELKRHFLGRILLFQLERHHSVLERRRG